ncbi:MAG: hypothetical protein ACXAC7_00380 [Candidatus Hodarchaeales archaeon]
MKNLKFLYLIFIIGLFFVSLPSINNASAFYDINLFFEAEDWILEGSSNSIYVVSENLSSSDHGVFMQGSPVGISSGLLTLHSGTFLLNIQGRQTGSFPLDIELEVKQGSNDLFVAPNYIRFDSWSYTIKSFVFEIEVEFGAQPVELKVHTGRAGPARQGIIDYLSLKSTPVNYAELNFERVLFEYSNDGIRGIEQDSNFIYISDFRDHCIKIYNFSGTLISDNITLESPPPFFPFGLDIYDHSFWTSDNIGNLVYRFDINGSLISTIYMDPVGYSTGITGIDVENNFIWITRHSVSKIFKYSLSGEFITFIDIPINNPGSISHAYVYFFLSDMSINRNIYLLSIDGLNSIRNIDIYKTEEKMSEISVINTSYTDFQIITTDWAESPFSLQRYSLVREIAYPDSSQPITTDNKNNQNNNAFGDEGEVTFFPTVGFFVGIMIAQVLNRYKN